MDSALTSSRRSDHLMCKAFRAAGVSLTDPGMSWSGLRCTDGMIVIAFREEDVQDAREGFRCRLWSPGIVPFDAVSRAAKRERFFHCQMAASGGKAMALVARGKLNEVDEAAALLQIDVILDRGEYWGAWGRASFETGAASALLASATVPPRLVRGPPSGPSPSTD